MKAPIISGLALSALLFSSALAGDKDALVEAGKMEANLWEATAAVYYFDYHDSTQRDKDALEDYEGDIKRFEDAFAHLLEEVDDQAKQKLAEVQKDWDAHKAASSKILNAKTGDKTDHAAERLKLWDLAQKIDDEVDEVIEQLAKN